MIDATRLLAGRKGIDAVTVQEICATAGIGRTSFYNYFTDVQEILLIVANEAGAQIRSGFEVIHGRLPRGLERLAVCLRMMLQLAVDDPELGLLITSLTRAFPESQARLQHEIATELEGACDAGQLRLQGKELNSLSQYLTIATLALTQEFALERLSPDDLDAHVGNLFRSVQG